MMESLVSGHQFTAIRERLAEKLEMIRFDPLSKYIQYTLVCMVQYLLILLF
jgi:hypothetical protein